MEIAALIPQPDELVGSNLSVHHKYQPDTLEPKEDAAKAVP
jgi:hypothetical protein